MWPQEDGLSFELPQSHGAEMQQFLLRNVSFLKSIQFIQEILVGQMVDASPRMQEPNSNTTLENSLSECGCL
jgi:hypothetical protein